MAKTAGKKRKAEAVIESRPTKGQKATVARANCPDGGAQVEIPGQLYNTGSREVFRFLDLPGEIRNQIYEVIMEISERTFPHTWPNRRLLPEYKRSPPKPLPFIGLTQTCLSIRKEFRPMWLSTHRFPLFSVAGYCKAFFPIRMPPVCYHNPAGTLRIWISEGWPFVTDMLPLLKFRLRFPKYNLHLVSGPLNVDSELMRIAEILVNNANTTWIRFIKQHIITQVLVKGSGRMQGTDPVRIVIKERHAPDWMRKCMGHARDDVDTYAERLGLGPINSDIGFGVDYS